MLLLLRCCTIVVSALLVRLVILLPKRLSAGFSVDNPVDMCVKLLQTCGYIWGEARPKRGPAYRCAGSGWASGRLSSPVLSTEVGMIRLSSRPKRRATLHAKLVFAEALGCPPRGTARSGRLPAFSRTLSARSLASSGQKNTSVKPMHGFPGAQVVEEKLRQAALAGQAPAEQVDPGDDRLRVGLGDCLLAASLVRA